MKTLGLNQMETIDVSASGRGCMIAGGVAFGLAIAGFFFAPAWVGAASIVGGGAMSGCFDY